MAQGDREDFYGYFGKAVRRLRSEKRMTQADLGRPLDLSRASVANIEAGRQHCSLYAAVVLADTLEVPLAQLLPPHDQVDVPALNDGLDRFRADIELVLSRAVSGNAPTANAG